MTEEITKEQAKTWARDHGTIYDEKGRVADIGAARKLALKENELRTMESDMERVVSGKFTSEQQKMYREIEGISEKYPGALKERVFGKNHVWFVNTSGKDRLYAFTPDRVVCFELDKQEGSVSTLNPEVFSDVLLSELNLAHYAPGKRQQYYSRDIMSKDVKPLPYANDWVIIRGVDVTSEFENIQGDIHEAYAESEKRRKNEMEKLERLGKL